MRWIGVTLELILSLVNRSHPLFYGKLPVKTYLQVHIYQLYCRKEFKNNLYKEMTFELMFYSFTPASP